MSFVILECLDVGAGSGETSAEAWTVILGVVLGLSASIGINVGNNMQALGLQQQEEAGLESKTRTFKLGTACFAVASIVNFGAFGFAPAS
eukprot:7381971-Prymnesium_polylepis.1